MVLGPHGNMCYLSYSYCMFGSWEAYEIFDTTQEYFRIVLHPKSQYFETFGLSEDQDAPELMSCSLNML